MFDFQGIKTWVPVGDLRGGELYRVVHRFTIDPSLDPPRTGQADTRKLKIRWDDPRPLELHTVSVVG